MSFQPGANLYTQGFGSRPENVEVPHLDVRPPNPSDVNFPIGKRWIDQVGGDEYTLTRQSSLGGVLTSLWSFLGGSTSDLNTLTASTGGALDPTAGNINIVGASANQIVTSGAGSTITLAIPAAFIAPGSITAAAGDITATDGNLVLGTAGNKLVSTSVGTTAAAGDNSIGTVALAGGTVTVLTTAVTAASIIMTSRQAVAPTGAAALGFLSIGTITPGVSFVINAVTPSAATVLQASDVSTIAWQIIN